MEALFIFISDIWWYYLRVSQSNLCFYESSLFSFWVSLFFFDNVDFRFIIFFLRDSYKKVPNLEKKYEEYAKEFKFPRGIPEFIANKDRFKNCTIYDEKHSMTNSDVIDPVLEQVKFFEVDCSKNIGNCYTKFFCKMF